MNKKAKRRAFFVFVLICMAYGAVAIRLNDRLPAQRVTEEGRGASPSGIQLAVPEKEEGPAGIETGTPRPPEEMPPKPAQREKGAAKEQRGLRPLSVAMVWYAVSERWLDRDELIPVRHAGAGTLWKRPLEILREGDEEGLREIGRMIGKKNLLAFLSGEGITADASLTAEELLLGKGMEADGERSGAAYRKYVPVEWAKDAALASAVNRGRRSQEDGEWLMPNLLNLPLRTAVEQLSGHTVRLKVYGSGLVVDQTPKALERLTGETECTLHGGAGRD